MHTFGRLTQSEHSENLSVKPVDSKAVNIRIETNHQVAAVLKPGEALEKYKKANPLNGDLIKKVQAVIQQKKARTDGTTVILSEHDWYELLINKLTDDEVKAELKDLDLDKHQAFFLKMFNAFRESLLATPPEQLTKNPQLAAAAKAVSTAPVKDYQQMLALIRQHPVVEDYSLFQYQDGLNEDGMVTTPFVHIKPHRLYQIPRLSAHSVRIYLSPKLTALPQLCDDLLAFSSAQKVPLYFKTLDLSVNRPMREVFNRLDRIIIYTDDQHLSQLLEFLEKYHDHHTDSFTNKNLPLSIAVKKGISITPELTPEQKQQFPQSASFNSYRAMILNDVANVTMEKMLLDKSMQVIRPRRHRTIKEIFEDFLAENYAKLAKQPRNQVKQTTGFRKLFNHLFQNNFIAPDQHKYIVERALKLTFADIIGNIEPASMAQAMQASYALVHQKYSTDPKNIAFNS